MGGGNLCLLSTNRHKLEEMGVIAEDMGFTISPCRGSRKIEIQSDSLEEIALYSAERASDDVRNAIVEDAGLFIKALDGFPGPYSSYVYRTLGCGGILRLMDGVDDRRAHFRSAIAYIDGRGYVRVFSGRVYGLITDEPMGSMGFGFDPIFVPTGYSRTFAEMDLKDKAWISHRGMATIRLLRWIEHYGKEI